MRFYEQGSDEPIESIQAFLGRGMGVALVPRGEGDPHICFVILAEDDGNWFASGEGASSWLHELREQFQLAQQWVENNCKPDTYQGKQYGWLFKSHHL